MHLLELHPHFKKARQLMQVLTEHEQWSRSELTRLQLEQLNCIWRHAVNHVPYYRRLFRERDLPKEFRDLDEYTSNVPILEKAVVRSRAVFSERANPGKWYHTGGSTGIPLAIYRERDADLEMLSAQYRFRSLWGVDIFDRTVMQLGDFSLVPSLSGWVTTLRTSVEDVMRNRTRLSPRRLGTEDLKTYLHKMNYFKPKALYGNSSALYRLSIEALKTGITVKSLSLVILTGEVVTPIIRDTAERAFPSANVVQEYGAAESLVIAYEDKQRLLRIREDIVLVETIPTRQEKLYRIIVSVLNNPSFPLLRYDIGDLTGRPITKTNSGFATLGPITGRSNDLLVTRSGRLVRPVASTFAAYISEHLPSVKRFSAHQFADGRVVVFLEVDSPTEQIDTTALVKGLTALLEGQPVEVKPVELIPANPSGKHSWLTSEMPVQTDHHTQT